MSVKMMIGVIKMFEKDTRRGVIALQDPSAQQEVGDVYFEAARDEPTQFREGQLVKFIHEGSRARDVAVLSEKY
jgi:hypothetical protein